MSQLENLVRFRQCSKNVGALIERIVKKWAPQAEERKAEETKKEKEQQSSKHHQGRDSCLPSMHMSLMLIDQNGFG